MELYGNNSHSHYERNASNGSVNHSSSHYSTRKRQLSTSPPSRSFSRRDDASKSYDRRSRRDDSSVATKRTPSAELAKRASFFTLKEFLEYQEHDIQSDEVMKLYNEYREEYLRHHLLKFFEDKKKEPW